MKRHAILRILGDLKPILKERYGVERLGIFGSFATENERADSDIDVVVDMPPDLFAMVHLKEQLEDALHTPVDLIRHQQAMNAFLKARIERDAIYV